MSKHDLREMTDEELDAEVLSERARRYGELTPEAKARQRISFAYGNANASNPNVTREMVERAAEKMKEEASDEQILD